MEQVEKPWRRGPRVRRTIAEKRRIVELTFEPGVSVAGVAQAAGVNANQVFKWRRAYSRGELKVSGERSTALLPVVVSDGAAAIKKPEPQEFEGREAAASAGTIHIELPGRAMISAESGADPLLLCAILESLSK
jgi:transposase